jgi:hypothetical protein
MVMGCASGILEMNLDDWSLREKKLLRFGYKKKVRTASESYNKQVEIQRGNQDQLAISLKKSVQDQ